MDSPRDAEARSELYCAAILNSVGVAAGEPERRLSGDGRTIARVRHAAASRSSDGSGTGMEAGGGK